MEKLARAPPPHPSQVKMVCSPNVPTDNLDSQGSILPSYNKELEEYCQFSVADEVNAIVYFGFACFEIYSRPNSPRSSSRFCRAGHTSGVDAKFARQARENERRSREKKSWRTDRLKKAPRPCRRFFKLFPPQSSRGFSALAGLYYLARPTKTAMRRRLTFEYNSNMTPRL